MSRIGAVDWDETKKGFQHKLGYCQCGSKILATTAELEEIAGVAYKRPKMFREIRERIAKILVSD